MTLLSPHWLSLTSKELSEGSSSLDLPKHVELVRIQEILRGQIIHTSYYFAWSYYFQNNYSGDNMESGERNTLILVSWMAKSLKIWYSQSCTGLLLTFQFLCVIDYDLSFTPFVPRYAISTLVCSFCGGCVCMASLSLSLSLSGSCYSHP